MYICKRCGKPFESAAALAGHSNIHTEKGRQNIFERSTARKGKTYEEIYGKEKASEIKGKQRHSHKKLIGNYREAAIKRWADPNSVYRDKDFIQRRAETLREGIKEGRIKIVNSSGDPKTRKRISEGVHHHLELIDIHAEELLKQGYRIIFKDTPDFPVRPDIIAIKDGEVYAIEVHTSIPKDVRLEKYKAVKDQAFDHVKWIIESERPTWLV